MHRYLWSLGAAFALSLAFCSGAPAAPASSADLSGKKICWDNGSASNYGPGGKYSNTMSGEGTWSMTAKGIHVHTDRYDYIASIEKLPGGSFQAVILGAGIKSTGSYCK